MHRANIQTGSVGYSHEEKSVSVPSHVKTFILAVILALPCTWIAISISDNVATPDSVRDILSPGTTLGNYLVFVQPPHNRVPQPSHYWLVDLRSLGDQLGQWLAVAFFTDLAFYFLLIFGLITITHALKKPN
jgi:hypothetical protein